jgi:NDP-sugar pyrophosphorylase family protein
LNYLLKKKLMAHLGAIDKIKKKIKSNFFIFNGDTLFNFNYLDLITLSKKTNLKKYIYL